VRILPGAAVILGDTPEEAMERADPSRGTIPIERRTGKLALIAQ
jgi:alkanesulfonate monooxygenase SsuD/methylene tetrahydromethanopterin reductase-like flavin-dependent oxidoreductase (luciferase family)